MPISNNNPPAAKSGENIIQALKQLSFDFYIDQNGTPQFTVKNTYGINDKEQQK